MSFILKSVKMEICIDTMSDIFSALCTILRIWQTSIWGKFTGTGFCAYTEHKTHRHLHNCKYGMDWLLFDSQIDIDFTSFSC